jgi:hypothetical protein
VHASLRFAGRDRTDGSGSRARRAWGAPFLTSSAAWLKKSYEYQPWRRGLISKV